MAVEDSMWAGSGVRPRRVKELASDERHDASSGPSPEAVSARGEANRAGGEAVARTGRPSVVASRLAETRETAFR